METFLKDKKINVSVFILVVVISLFTIVKIVNEVKNGGISHTNQPVNTITVSGTGESLAVSDIASLSININKDGKTAKEAQDLLNTDITKVLNYLKGQKIADKDIKSEYGGLNP